MSNKVVASAPGKLMLMGEHAVVYNHPCLVTAVGQRMKVEIEKIEEDFLLLNAPDVNISNYSKSLDSIGTGDIPKGALFVEMAVKNFYSKYNIHYGVQISTFSEFSSLFGFGSSSAATVCVVKALSSLNNISLSNEEIFDLSYKTVLDVQGKGSGFDIAAAVYGGTLYFVTGGKIIEKLQVSSLPLIVGYSGVKADTVTLINKVSEKAKKYPQIIENSYDQIERLVELAKKLLLAEDWHNFGELMNMNQGYLELLGVSGYKLSQMIYAARDNGAYGAKLSGAGGGDCMIAVASDGNIDTVKQSIERVDGKILEVETNVKGVRIE